MAKKNKLELLIEPSLSSGISVIVAVTTILLVTVWTTFKNYLIAQQMTDGINEIANQISKASGSKEAFVNSFFGSPQFNQGLYIAMWAFVGVLVYFIVMITVKGFSNMQEVLSIRNKANTNKKSEINDVLIRSAFRLLVICFSYIYCMYLIQFIIPVSVLCIQAGVKLDSLLDGVYVFIGILLLLLSFHLVTILLRLIFLRIRVFGGAQEMVLES